MTAPDEELDPATLRFVARRFAQLAVAFGLRETPIDDAKASFCAGHSRALEAQAKRIERKRRPVRERRRPHGAVVGR